MGNTWSIEHEHQVAWPQPRPVSPVEDSTWVSFMINARLDGLIMLTNEPLKLQQDLW